MTGLKLIKIVKKADDCLADARALFEESSFEASVNRSYYSIFHLIQALLFVSNVVSKLMLEHTISLESYSSKL